MVFIKGAFRNRSFFYLARQAKKAYYTRMKEIMIPLLHEELAQNSDEIMASYDFEGTELEYPWPKYKPRALFTGIFIAAGIDGIACSFCAEIPKNKTNTKHEGHKEKVFEDDCVEIFIKPAESEIYYGWEINSKGFCLDYRAGCGEKGKEIIFSTMNEPKTEFDGSPVISGYIEDTILEEKITFDYNWKSQYRISTGIEDEFWYTDIFIPWTDFSLPDTFSFETLEAKEWQFTCNRIDKTGMELAKEKSIKSSAKLKGTPKKINPGLQTLIEGTDYPSFHQSSFFAVGKFQKYEQVIKDNN